VTTAHGHRAGLLRAITKIHSTGMLAAQALIEDMKLVTAIRCLRHSVREWFGDSAV